MEPIPALDLRHGRAVRLRQGDDERVTVYGEPTEVVAGFARAGARRIHIVDLDAALDGRPQGELIARLLAVASGLAVQLGGGLRDEAAIEAALAAGCERVVVGSLAAREPERFRRLARALPGRLVPALDVAAGEVRIAGWREGSRRSLVDLCRELRDLPCPAVLVTDVERDGMMTGPNLDLACKVAEAMGMPALLSGGVHCLEDLEAAALRKEIAGAIVGRALYEGVFTLEQAVEVCAAAEGGGGVGSSGDGRAAGTGGAS
jgi:phosphoribosylformimino-5-aminoimidazole carboxamide ribotide isomerase